MCEREWRIYVIEREGREREGGERERDEKVRRERKAYRPSSQGYLHETRKRWEEHLRLFREWGCCHIRQRQPRGQILRERERAREVREEGVSERNGSCSCK